MFYLDTGLVIIDIFIWDLNKLIHSFILHTAVSWAIGLVSLVGLVASLLLRLVWVGASECVCLGFWHKGL